LCGSPHKNQRGLELKIILSIGNDEEPIKIYDPTKGIPEFKGDMVWVFIPDNGRDPRVS